MTSKDSLKLVLKQITREKRLAFYFEEDDFPSFNAYVVMSKTHFYDCLDAIIDTIEKILASKSNSIATRLEENLHSISSILDLTEKCIRNNLQNVTAELSEEFSKRRLIPLLLKLFVGDYKGSITSNIQVEKNACKCLYLLSSSYFNHIFMEICKRITLASKDEEEECGELISFGCLDLNFSNVLFFLSECFNLLDRKKGHSLCMTLLFIKNAIYDCIAKYSEDFNKFIETPKQETDELLSKWSKYLIKVSDQNRLKPFSLPLLVNLMFLSQDFLKSFSSGQDIRSFKASSILNIIEKGLESPKSNIFDTSFNCIIKYCSVSQYISNENINFINKAYLKYIESIKRIILNASNPGSSFADSYRSPLIIDAAVLLISSDDAKIVTRECIIKDDAPYLIKSAFINAYIMEFEKNTNNIAKKKEILSDPVVYSYLYSKFIKKSPSYPSDTTVSTVKSISKETLNNILAYSYKAEITKLYRLWPELAIMPCNLYSNYDLTELFKEILSLLIQPNWDPDFNSAAIISYLHSADYINIWIADHPYAINKITGTVCSSYLNHNINNDVLAGILNWLIHIYNSRHKLNFAKINIRCLYESNGLLEPLESIEVFLYICLLSSKRNISQRAMECFKCLNEEVKVIKIQNASLFNETQYANLQTIKYYKQLSEIVEAHSSSPHDILNKLFSVINELSSYRKSIAMAFTYIFPYFKNILQIVQSSNTCLEESSPNESIKLLSSFELDKEARTQMFRTCLNFLCSCCYSMYEESSANMNQIMPFLSLLNEILYKESLMENNDITIINIIIESIKEKINYKLYPSLMFFINQTISKSVKTELIFPFCENIVLILWHLMKESNQFMLLIESGNLNQLLLHLSKMSGSNEKILKHITYRNQMTSILDLFIMNINSIQLDNISQIKHQLLSNLITWLPPLQSKSSNNESDVDSVVSLTLCDIKNYQSLNIHAIFKCIASVLNGFSINLTLFEDIRCKNKKEFLERYLKIFSSHVNSKDSNEQSIDLINIVAQCMANLILSNPDVGSNYLLTLANTSMNNSIWVVVMETLAQVISKAGDIDGITNDFVTEHYEKILDILTFFDVDTKEFPIISEILKIHLLEKVNDIDIISSLIIVFANRGKLYDLLYYIFKQEVENNASLQTLFRSGSVGVTFLASAFKIYGDTFAKILIEPLLNYISLDHTKSYEVDPNKINKLKIGESLQNLTQLTVYFIQHLLSLINTIPDYLRIICTSLFQVISQKYPQQALTSVGSIFFLRLVNPHLVNPKKFNQNNETNSNFKRALMLLSKIIQCIANQVVNKESYMEPLNGLITNKFQDMYLFLRQLCSCPEEVPSTLTVFGFENMSNIQLWAHSNLKNIENISKKNTKNNDQKNISLFIDLIKEVKLCVPNDNTCLINGYDNQSKSLLSISDRGNQSSMYTSNIGLNCMDDDLLTLDQIFFQYGTSEAGNKVFYLNFVPYYPDRITTNDVINHVCKQIDCVSGESMYELVVNCLKIGTCDKIIMEVFNDLCNNPNYENSNILKIFKIYIVNLTANMCIYAKSQRANITKFMAKRNVIFINCLDDIVNYIAINNLHSSIDHGLLPIHNSSFLVNYMELNTNLMLGNRHLILQYRDACPIILGIVGYLEYYSFEMIKEYNSICWDTIQISLQNGDSFSFKSNHVDDIESLLKKYLPKKQNISSSKISSKLFAFDSFGSCFCATLTLLLCSEKAVEISAKNLMKCLCNMFEINKKEEIISMKQQQQQISLSIKKAVEFSENVAKSQPALTFGVFIQMISFFEKSDSSLRRNCLKLVKPWNISMIKIIETCKSDERIRFMQIIEKLIHLTISFTDHVDDFSKYIWKPISHDIKLVEYCLHSFLKITAASYKDYVIVNTLLTCSVALSFTFKNQFTSYILRSLESHLQTATHAYRKSERLSSTSGSGSGNGSGSGSGFISGTGTGTATVSLTGVNSSSYGSEEIFNIHFKYLNTLVINDHFFYSDYFPAIFYYCFLNLLIESEKMPPIPESFLLICNSLDGLIRCKDISFSNSLIENIQLIANNTPSIIYNKSTRSRELTSFTTQSSYNDIPPKSTNSNTDFIETLSETVNYVLAICTKDKPQLNWLNIYHDLILKYAFSDYPTLQQKSLILFGLCDDKRESSFNYLLLTTSNSSKQQNRSILNSCIYAFNKYVIKPNTDTSMIGTIFWVSIGALMMLEREIYYNCLLLLYYSLQALLRLDSCIKDNFEGFLIKHLEKIDIDGNMKKLFKPIGLNIELSFNFSLMPLIFKSVNHSSKKISTISISLLKTLLKMTTTDFKKETVPTRVTIRNLPYFIALINLDSNIQEELFISTYNANKNISELPSLTAPTSLSNDIFYIGNILFDKNIKNSSLEQILSMLTFIKGLKNSSNSQDNFIILFSIKLFFQEFPNTKAACQKILNPILIEKILKYNDKETYLLINDILISLNNVFENKDSIPFSLISSKGFFGFISTISPFQKIMFGSKVWDILALFFQKLSSLEYSSNL